MSIADELRKLEELRRSGALTDHEFALAKAKVLAGQDQPAHGTPADEELHDHLAELKRENELARLDREWQMERERYQVSGRYGNRYMPNKFSAILIGVLTVGFGTFWTIMAAGMGGGLGAPGIFPFFGVVFILVGIGVSAFSFMRANQYEEVHSRCQRRRALILAGELSDAPVAASPQRPRQASSTKIQDFVEPAPVPCLRCGRTDSARR